MLYFLFLLVLCFVCYCMPFLRCWWIRLQTGQGRLRLYHQTWRQAPAPFMLRLDLRDFQITEPKYPNVKVDQLCRHVQVLPHHHTAGISTCLHIWYVSRLQEHWQESLMDPRPNPHYSPETSVKAENLLMPLFILFVSFWCWEIAIHGGSLWIPWQVTLLNFAITPTGLEDRLLYGFRAEKPKTYMYTVNAKKNYKLLVRIALMLSEASFLIYNLRQDQMLGIVVAKERPDLEEQKSQLVRRNEEINFCWLRSSHLFFTV